MSSIRRWGRRGKYLQIGLIACFDSLKVKRPDLYLLLWDSFIQGKGSAAKSGDTHKEGYAADFDLSDRRWSNQTANDVAYHLKGSCALAFRLKGELGTEADGRLNPAHLHIALYPFSNSKAIRAASGSNDEMYRRINLLFPQPHLFNLSKHPN